MVEDKSEQIHSILEGFNTAMLITRGTDDLPHARPMAIASVEPNCDVWFFTGRGNAMVNELHSDERVVIVCQDARHPSLSLSGRAELVVDRAKARELWDPSYEAWFPDGVEDAQLLLIHVQAEEAEFWDQDHPMGCRHSFHTMASSRPTRPQVGV